MQRDTPPRIHSVTLKLAHPLHTLSAYAWRNRVNSTIQGPDWWPVKRHGRKPLEWTTEITGWSTSYQYSLLCFSAISVLVHIQKWRLLLNSWVNRELTRVKCISQGSDIRVRINIWHCDWRFSSWSKWTFFSISTLHCSCPAKDQSVFRHSKPYYFYWTAQSFGKTLSCSNSLNTSQLCFGCLW